MKNEKKLLPRVLAVVLAVLISVGSTVSALAATVEAKRVCGKDEQPHTEECYTKVTKTERTLTCEDPAHTHTHGDECYETVWELVCDIPEAEAEAGTTHVHGDSCYETVEVNKGGELVCQLPEHTHGSECYTEEPAAPVEGAEGEEPVAAAESVRTLTCEQAEHTHSGDCYSKPVTTKQLTCTESDLPAHKHGEGCYVQEKKLVCTLEGAHTEECYTEVETTERGVLDCPNPEHHVHTKDCYDSGNVAGDLKDALANYQDEEIVLILNGTTLTYNLNGKNDIELRNGQTLTIRDGVVAGGEIKNTGNSSRLIIVTNGTVNLTGSTKLTGGSGTGGGAVYIGANGTFNMYGGEISGNHSQANGGAVLVEGGEFNMRGGAISGNTAANDGGGVAVDKGGKFNMYDGEISGNSAVTGDGEVTKENGDAAFDGKKSEYKGQGGGVYVGSNAGSDGSHSSFAMSGGAIKDNTADEGGGVFIDRESVSKYGQFAMTGGSVDGNTALYGEGGGIYVQGEGTISGGEITNNVTYTWTDLGGGGIYIEADGELTLTNAIITANKANGQGGGIAACVHGKTVVYVKDGAAIFGNSADGQGHTEGHKKADGTYNGGFIDGYALWAGEEIFENCANDIFAAGDAVQVNAQGVAGIAVSNAMPGEGNKANWSGWTYCYVTDPATGLPKNFGTDAAPEYAFELTEITANRNGTVVGNRLMFLTADPSDEAIQSAVKAVKELANGGVLIANNLSANAHGGGIANNGVLNIGDKNSGVKGDPTGSELGMEKTLVDSDNDDAKMELEGGEFTFSYQVKDEAGNVIQDASVSNDENGKAVFDLPAEIFEKAGTYTFYISEVASSEKYAEGITYDKTAYKVTIIVTEEQAKIQIGGDLLDVTTLVIGDPIIEKIAEDGTHTYVDSVSFNNSYSKPQNPQDPQDPPGGGETPRDPGNDPDPDPDPELPEPELPLDELPELPEPEIPLDEEPELELPDPDIPLADVPETGDISLGWYVAAFLSACGLGGLLFSSKKREGQEG